MVGGVFESERGSFEKEEASSDAKLASTPPRDQRETEHQRCASPREKAEMTGVARWPNDDGCESEVKET